jgi:hypothetical protein
MVAVVVAELMAKAETDQMRCASLPAQRSPFKSANRGPVALRQRHCGTDAAIQDLGFCRRHDVCVQDHLRDGTLVELLEAMGQSFRRSRRTN